MKSRDQTGATYLRGNPTGKTTVQERIQRKLQWYSLISRARVSGLDWSSPFSLEGVYYLYKYVSLDEATKFSSIWTSSYLNYLSWRPMELNILIWIGRARVRLHPAILVQL